MCNKEDTVKQSVTKALISLVNLTYCRLCRASGNSCLHGTRSAQPQPPYYQCTGQPASRREHLHPHLHGLPQTSHNQGSQSHGEYPVSFASWALTPKKNLDIWATLKYMNVIALWWSTPVVTLLVLCLCEFYTFI